MEQAHMAKKKPRPITPSEPPYIRLTPLQLLGLKERAPQPVKDILLAIAALTAADNDNLCSWLHNFLHHDWQIVRTADLAEMERDLHRMTNMVMKYGSRENRTKRPELYEVVIKLWAGGPKEGGLSAEQILGKLQRMPEYRRWMTKQKTGEPLNRNDIEAILTRHKKKLRKPDRADS
jgi:hypothetical protein